MSAGFERKVPLGGTGLSVSRVGIGSSYGAPRDSCVAAFDAGINYFFWGSTRTRGMALAIRDLVRAGHRDELVVVLQSYVRFGSLVRRSVEKGLSILGLDRADILLLGWHDKLPAERIVAAAEKLRQAGRFRHLAISSHQRPLFRELLEEARFDVFHLRYNAAHRGAEQDVFPHLPRRGGPGIVSFTCTRWGDLLNPEKMPPGEAPLSAADCYRFVFTDPRVHTAICGPKNDDEVRGAIDALRRGPLDAEELARARRIGDHVYAQKSVADWFR